jgi:hypothetical protein
MADIVDKADEQNEAYLRSVLARRLPGAPAATGRCLNCEEPLAPGVRWCDIVCRDDWQRRQERN